LTFQEAQDFSLNVMQIMGMTTLFLIDFGNISVSGLTIMGKRLFKRVHRVRDLFRFAAIQPTDRNIKIVLPIETKHTNQKCDKLAAALLQKLVSDCDCQTEICWPPLESSQRFVDPQSKNFSAIQEPLKCF
jgi:hypothetical protein